MSIVVHVIIAGEADESQGSNASPNQAPPNYDQAHLLTIIPLLFVLHRVCANQACPGGHYHNTQSYRYIQGGSIRSKCRLHIYYHRLQFQCIAQSVLLSDVLGLYKSGSQAIPSDAEVPVCEGINFLHILAIGSHFHRCQVWSITLR